MNQQKSDYQKSIENIGAWTGLFSVDGDKILEGDTVQQTKNSNYDEDKQPIFTVVRRFSKWVAISEHGDQHDMENMSPMHLVYNTTYRVIKRFNA